MRGTVPSMTPRRTTSRAASALCLLLLFAALTVPPAHADTSFTAPAYPSAACTPVAGGLNLGIAPQQWNSVAGLLLYATGWAIAAVRTGTPNMGALCLVALGGAAAGALLFGTPDQYLIQACTLALAALLPGLWLASGRRL